MTVTASISGQSIGTSTNVGEGKFPIKVTRQTTSMIYSLAARLTNGAGEYHQAKEVRVWYANSPFSITAAQAVSQLRNEARYLDIRPDPSAAGVIIKSSLLETVVGDYIYFWCDIPNQTVAQTLDVSLVELP